MQEAYVKLKQNKIEQRDRDGLQGKVSTITIIVWGGGLPCTDTAGKRNQGKDNGRSEVTSKRLSESLSSDRVE